MIYWYTCLYFFIFCRIYIWYNRWFFFFFRMRRSICCILFCLWFNLVWPCYSYRYIALILFSYISFILFLFIYFLLASYYHSVRIHVILRRGCLCVCVCWRAWVSVYVNVFLHIYIQIYLLEDVSVRVYVKEKKERGGYEKDPIQRNREMD